jgi:8-oxo-dGTP pyrophosphatase MutT (NUDIX family)
MLHTNICFLLRDGKILLAMKKRGFGVGKWNGAGGKCQGDETPLEAAVREVQEEICVELKEEHLRHVALIRFHFPHKPEWDQECSVFLTEHFEGEPGETEEMRPEWFAQNDIPYHAMWSDDIHWLPKVLEGNFVEARFAFDEESNVLEKDVVCR